VGKSHLETACRRSPTKVGFVSLPVPLASAVGLWMCANLCMSLCHVVFHGRAWLRDLSRCARWHKTQPTCGAVCTLSDHAGFDGLKALHDDGDVGNAARRASGSILVSV